MPSSTNRLILIGNGIAALGVVGYYTYNILTEDSPLGQLARSRLGLDNYTGIDLFKDRKVRDYYKSQPLARGYHNISKPIIELYDKYNYRPDVRDSMKKFEDERAEKFFGRFNVAPPTF